MATPQVNTSRVITNLSALIHNRRVAEYIKNELKADLGNGDLRDIKFSDVKSKAKALATALIIKRKDTPILATSKMQAFHLLFDRPWENIEFPQTQRVKTDHFPCLVINFREKLKTGWAKDTYVKTICFPDNDVIAKVKQGKAPHLPMWKSGRYYRLHEFKNGTAINVFARTDNECKKWIKLLQDLVEPKYHNLEIKDYILRPKSIGEKDLYPRNVYYYPEGRANKQKRYTGYF